MIGQESLGQLDDFACRQLNRLGGPLATPGLSRDMLQNDDLMTPDLSRTSSDPLYALPMEEGLRYRGKGKGELLGQISSLLLRFNFSDCSYAGDGGGHRPCCPECAESGGFLAAVGSL